MVFVKGLKVIINGPVVCKLHHVKIERRATFSDFFGLIPKIFSNRKACLRVTIPRIETRCEKLQSGFVLRELDGLDKHG